MPQHHLPTNATHRTDATLATVLLTTDCAGPSEGSQALGNALSSNSTLLTLDIGNNSVGVQGLVHVLDGIRAHQRLTALDVSDNQLGDDGAEAVSKEMVRCPALRFVRVAGNDICSRGGQALADSLEASLGMQSLDVTRNRRIPYEHRMKMRIYNNLHDDGSENPLTKMSIASEHDV